MARYLRKKKRGPLHGPRVPSSAGFGEREGRGQDGNVGGGKLKKDGTGNERGARQGARSPLVRAIKGEVCGELHSGYVRTNEGQEIRGIISASLRRLCNRIIGPTGDVVPVTFIICQLSVNKRVTRVWNTLVDGICMYQVRSDHEKL